MSAVLQTHVTSRVFCESRISSCTSYSVQNRVVARAQLYRLKFMQLTHSTGMKVYITTMPLTVDFPYDSLIRVRPLNHDGFAEFGNVIENPKPALVPSTTTEGGLPPNVVLGNQGTALKYQDVTDMQDLYSCAPSGVTSKAVMNMFVCAPRTLRHSQSDDLRGIFPVEILERHPFTTQTFIPLGLSGVDQERAFYLVIVAPSLSPSHADRSLPVPAQTPSTRLPGRGLPDLARLQAFVAKGSQAVTYGAGTWHAPMVVIGTKPVDFVVVQFANGVKAEDCQEVVMQYRGEGGIQIAIPKVEAKRYHGSAKL